VSKLLINNSLANMLKKSKNVQECDATAA